MKSKKFLSLALSLVMALTMAAPAMAEEGTTAEPEVVAYTVPADVEGKLVILHTNDTHGHDVAVEGKTVGTAGVAALKKAFEAAGASVLLVSAGDFSQGTTLVSLDKGASAVKFMNAAGYDVAAPGNHEFDYKMEALSANLELAEFPILAANIVKTEDNKPLFGDRTTFDTKVGKVGVFGLDTPETMTKAHPDNVKGLSFYQGEELVKCAQAQVKALQDEKCDYIIAISHLGTDPESEPNRSEDVFAGIKGVDLIIDGHSHTEIDGGKDVNGALLVSAGEQLNNVGVVITDGKDTTAELVSAAEWTTVDEDVAAVVNARDEEVKAELEKTFATTEVLLNGERAPGNRTEETNLGDYAADAILWSAKQALGEDKVDIALTNGGGIRASIQVGDITMNTMKTVFPFGNEVATIELTGAELVEALEAATCSTPTAIGAFPQVAGMSFTIDTRVEYVNGEQYPDSTYFAPAAPGSRIKDVMIGEEPVDLEKTYVLATNDFTAAGGDTYGVFLGKSVYKTGVALEDALVNYTRDTQNNVITAAAYGEPAGRITVINPMGKFTDIKADAWYVKPITEMVNAGVLEGTSETTFAPEATLTVAEIYQTLYNVAGNKAEDAAETDPWWTDAMAWAAETGIYEGKAEEFTNHDAPRSEVKEIMDLYLKSVGNAEVELFQGNQDGDMMWDKTITRAEWAQVLVRVAANPMPLAE